MNKNEGGKWVVFAFQGEGGANPGNPVTGDAANITANIRIDGGAANPIDDTNPTELEDGYYVFDITAAESNGDMLLICPASATGNVLVIGVPGTVFTTDSTDLADAILARAVENVEDTADKHSLAAIIMLGTNSAVSTDGTQIRAKKPSNDSLFFAYTITSDSDAYPITGIS